MRAPDEALAELCEATREDVNDLIAFSAGAFDRCPICGKLASEHPARPVSGDSV